MFSLLAGAEEGGCDGEKVGVKRQSSGNIVSTGIKNKKVDTLRLLIREIF